MWNHCGSDIARVSQIKRLNKLISQLEDTQVLFVGVVNMFHHPCIYMLEVGGASCWEEASDGTSGLGSG